MAVALSTLALWTALFAIACAYTVFGLQLLLARSRVVDSSTVFYTFAAILATTPAADVLRGGLHPVWLLVWVGLAEVLRRLASAVARWARGNGLEIATTREDDLPAILELAENATGFKGVIVDRPTFANRKTPLRVARPTPWRGAALFFGRPLRADEKRGLARAMRGRLSGRSRLEGRPLKAFLVVPIGALFSSLIAIGIVVSI